MLAASAPGSPSLKRRRSLGTAAPCPAGGSHKWPPTIQVFVRDPCFLGDEDISVLQMAALKALYGEPLDAEEMKAFLEVTEGRPPRPGGYTEATLLCGIRSGKTDKFAAIVAIYSAYIFDDSILAAGERAYFPIIAQNIEGARTAWGYVEGKARLLESKGRKFPDGRPLLEPGTGQMKSITGKEIRFSNHVIVACFPCNKSSIRGKTCIGGIGDEFAFWDTEEAAHDSDVEIFRALAGRMATMKGRAKLVKITSPFLETGVAYSDWKERTTAKRLFIQAPSWVLNPSLADGPFLDEARDNDPEGFNREYAAQFGRGGGTYLTPARVDEAMVEDRPQYLPPQRGLIYMGWIDVAFKHDLYAFGIAHRDEVTGVVFDVLRWWQGTPKEPLDSKEIAREVALVLKAYGLSEVNADQFAAVPVAADYAEYGIFLREVPETAQRSWAAFECLKGVMRRSRLQIPKHDLIRRDLLSLVKTKAGPKGIPRVAAPDRKGLHDDISKVVANLTFHFEPALKPLDIEEWNRNAEMNRHRYRTVATSRGYTDRMWSDDHDGDEDIPSASEIMDMDF